MPDKLENKLKLPPGLSPKEEGEWWQEHREYWEQFDESEWEVVEPGPEGSTSRFPYMRLPTTLVATVHALAVAQNMTTPELIVKWIEERVKAESDALARTKSAKPKLR